MNQAAIQNAIREYLELMGAPAGAAPAVGHIASDGASITVEGSTYIYTLYEKGAETEKHQCACLDDALYLALEPVASELASRFAARHALAEQFRACLLAKEFELLTAIRPEWGQRFTNDLGRG